MTIRNPMLAVKTSVRAAAHGGMTTADWNAVAPVDASSFFVSNDSTGSYSSIFKIPNLTN